MQKKLVGSLLMAMSVSAAHAASFDDVKLSGFGSFAVGQANNDAGYAGYDSDVNVSQDTLAGIQLDVKINDQAKFVTQMVANARYDYDVAVEMAYFSYEFNDFTVRAGKLRTPFFMYSDYLDVGYAYPMLRPSQEVYENLVISSYTGVDFLIPIEFENSSLLLQPVAGIAKIDERDSGMFNEVFLDQFIGATVHWYVDDFTLRGSYMTAKTDYEGNEEYNEKDGTFASVGAQYDNGDLLVMLEAAETTLDGEFTDAQSASAVLGYRFGKVMPYAMANWIKTTDDEERDGNLVAEAMSFKKTAYSLGARMEVAKNIALKLDVTYSDFHDTSGGLDSNVDLTTGTYNEDDVLVYSAAIDYVF